MSTTTDVNRALAYRYLLRAAMLPLTVIVLLISLGTVGLVYAASSVSLWWLVFLIPLLGLALLFTVAFGAGFALLRALKPRELSKPQQLAIDRFIDQANETIGGVQGLRGGPFAIVFGILMRKYRNRGQSLVDAVIAPLRNTPELRDQYKQLLKDFDRVDVQNQVDR